MDSGRISFMKSENTIEKQQLFPAAGPTQEWSAGLSSKPCSISPKIAASLSTQGHRRGNNGDCS